VESGKGQAQVHFAQGFRILKLKKFNKDFYCKK
jgi:hypothetical protein